MSIIRQVVDRQHVGTSNRGVIRAVRKAFAPEGRRAPRLREVRKDVYREALEIHAANRKLFTDWRF